MNDRNNNCEINIAPVPLCYREQMRRYGLWYFSYYDSVKCTRRFSRENSGLRFFEFHCITQMLNHSGFYKSSELADMELKKNDIVVAARGDSVRYGSYEEFFCEDSVAFLGNTADMLRDCGILKSGIYHLDNTRRLLPIIEKIREAALPALLESASRLQELIFELHHAARRGNNRQEEHQARINLLMREIKKDLTHWWTIPEMAAFCNISENYLRILFRQTMGLSPKQYMDNLRITRAAELLSSTENSIEEISLALGYQDIYHFMRRFARIMGIPPARYRKENAAFLQMAKRP